MPFRFCLAAVCLSAILAAGCTNDVFYRAAGLPTPSEAATIRMLQEHYRACLRQGREGDFCRQDLLAYRACRDSEKTDAECRTELFQ